MSDIDPATVALLTETIPALCAPYVETDAESATPEWWVAMSARYLQQAASIFHDNLTDLT